MIELHELRMFDSGKADKRVREAFSERPSDLNAYTSSAFGFWVVGEVRSRLIVRFPVQDSEASK
jgi:hypothetical protein